MESFEKSFEEFVNDSKEIDNIESFNKRRAELSIVAAKLKNDFIDLDEIIDRFISMIEPWYVMPSSMRRPHIICLWGMTGVGKTDLIRKLVRYLGFADRFLEVQMSSDGGSPTKNYYSEGSIQSRIEFSNLEAETPGILFLDEIQRYRTKNERGESATDGKTDQDIWQLLSDGKFASSTRKAELLEIMYSKALHDYSAKKIGVKIVKKDDDLEEDEDKEDEQTESVYKRGYYNARKLKRILKLKDSVSSIMKWTDAYQEETIKAALKNDDLFVGDDYSKLLIIISGNIDEAYKMSFSVEDTDTEADILHQHSKNINLLNIKSALLHRFYPEQIARFGNNHIIYPSFSKNSYFQIIKKTLSDISKNLQDKYNIQLQFSEELLKFIYRNGVFPAQGVRPVFSTISGTVETLVPNIVIDSIEKNLKNVLIDYDLYNKSFVIINNDNKEVIFKKTYEGDIDKIKKKSSLQYRTICAVHEIGHAIVYAKLFGAVPTQIEGSPAEKSIGGFVGMHPLQLSYQGIRNKIAVCLAGMVAEEQVFNEQSSGSFSDLAKATELANALYKEYAMGDDIRVKATPWKEPDAANLSSPDDDKSDIHNVESLLKDMKAKAKSIIRQYNKLFAEASQLLIKEGSLTPEVFKSLCDKHDLRAEIYEPDFTIYPNYVEKFETFIKFMKD